MEEEFDLDNELADEERYYNEMMMMSQLDEGGEITEGMELEEEHGQTVSQQLEIVPSHLQEIPKEPNDRNSTITLRHEVGAESHAAIEALNQEYFQSRNKIPKEKYKPTLHHSEQRGGGPSNSFSSSSHAFLSYSSLVTQFPSYRTVHSVTYLKDRPPLGEDSETVTLPNGKRKYLYYRQQKKKSEDDGKYSLRDSLLSRPIEEILKEAERNKIIRLASSSSSSSSTTSLAPGQGNTLLSKAHQLWVDKYAPKSFPQVFIPPPSTLAHPPSLPSSRSVIESREIES
jgi:hypothetical protein